MGELQELVDRVKSTAGEHYVSMNVTKTKAMMATKDIVMIATSELRPLNRE